MHRVIQPLSNLVFTWLCLTQVPNIPTVFLPLVRYYIPDCNSKKGGQFLKFLYQPFQFIITPQLKKFENNFGTF